jgi:hypothetical protein
MATFPIGDDFIYDLVNSASFTEETDGSQPVLSPKLLVISNNRISLDLFPSEDCPTLPNQGQVWPQGLFFGSYANLANGAPTVSESTEFVDYLYPVSTN